MKTTIDKLVNQIREAGLALQFLPGTEGATEKLDAALSSALLLQSFSTRFAEMARDEARAEYARQAADAANGVPSVTPMFRREVFDSEGAFETYRLFYVACDAVMDLSNNRANVCDLEPGERGNPCLYGVVNGYLDQREAAAVPTNEYALYDDLEKYVERRQAAGLPVRGLDDDDDGGQEAAEDTVDRRWGDSDLV